MKAGEVYPFSFVFLQTKLEHQLTDLYASQINQVLSCDRWLEAHLKQQQGHQQAVAMKFSIFVNSKKTTTAVRGVEHHKLVLPETNWNGVSAFQK